MIAARPGLGTINHTVLTVESARGAGLEVHTVVLTPWPDQPSVMERSNAATIAAACDVEVAFLPRVPELTPDALAAAGAELAARVCAGEATRA
jgi:dethiobiotin synthetase